MANLLRHNQEQGPRPFAALAHLIPDWFRRGRLYISEGLPYGIVKDLVPVYLRVHGVDLTKITILYAVGFAWTLKFFRPPLVDISGPTGDGSAALS